MPRLGPRLAPSPRLRLAASLRQGLALLVLDRDELRQAIETAVAENPLLEFEATSTEETSGEATGEKDPAPHEEPFFPEDLPEADGGGDTPPPEAVAPPPPLTTYLAEQIACLHMTERDRTLAVHLLDRLDDRGYLTESPEEIGSGFPGDPPPAPEELDAVRHRLQGLDPVGCFSFDLGDCLRAQVRRRGDLSSETRALLIALLEFPLVDLARGRDETLAQRLGRKTDEITHARRLLRSFDPAPGAGWGGLPAVRLLPDLLIEADENGWRVRLPDDLPRLRLCRLRQGRRHGADSADWRRCRDEARGLLHGLALRRQALLSLGEALLRHQEGFFRRGASALNPLRQRTLAAELGVHESTLSRLIQSKYVFSPQGLHPLKFFFPPPAGGGAEGGASPQAVHAALVEILAAESPRHPYRDGDLVGLLARRGIMVARRTVSKYRDTYGIPPWHERRAHDHSSGGDERR